MIKLALTDLDDTLIAFGAQRASDRSRAAFHAMIDAGLHVGPVTGRLPADMEWMFSGDGACYATGAFANGQVIRVDNRTVHEVLIPAHLLEEARRALDATAGEGYLALYDPWTLGKIAYVTSTPDALRKNPPETYGHITEIVPDVASFPASGALPDGEPGYVKANVQCSCPRERICALRDHLRAAVPGLDFVLPSATAAVIDILPRGWGKGDAVRVLTRELGLSPQEVVAFGDSENDLAMIRATVNSVAVANASEQVAREAAWHIGACADGAVDDALLDIADAARTGRLPGFMEEATL